MTSRLSAWPTSRRVSRRDWLRQTAAAGVLTGLPIASVRAMPDNTDVVIRRSRSDIGRLLDPEHMRTLALRAVDAARTAGATYADVRCTRTVKSEVGSDSEMLAVGVRALCDGTWGFAACPYWEPDNVVRVAREAVSQAKVNAVGKAERVELGTIPVATGMWTMPGIDPFTIPIEERAELLNGWLQSVADRPGTRFFVKEGKCDYTISRQERCFASTEGSLITQIVYLCHGEFAVTFQAADWRQSDELVVKASGLGLAGKGWELFLEARVRDQIPLLLDASQELRRTRIKPVEVGRYPMVLDAATAGSLVDCTFGVATQFDRALGYEANAGGTSYLGPDPLALLGTYVAASPVVTVTANRAMPGGAATVRWDDEGVTPVETTLVTRGILTDYQTTREQAAWLAPYYQKIGTPVRSRGDAASPSAFDEPIQHVPNLVLNATPNGPTFEALVAQIEKGIAVQAGHVSTDMQARTGYGSSPIVREITKGRLGARLKGAAFIFNATEIWKDVQAVGGTSSVGRLGVGAMKGEPRQETFHSVEAPALAIANATIIDLRRIV